MEIVKPLIFYKTTADFYNTGEVLIYKSLLEFLRQYGEIIVDDSPHIQPLFLQRIGIRDEEKLHSHTRHGFIHYILLTALRNIFSRRPLFFVTGVGDHKVKGAKKNVFSFAFLLLCKLCGMRTLRIGMSISFANKAAYRSERLLAKVIPYYYVRDSLSLEACHQAGIYKAMLAPDLSWGYTVPRKIEKSAESPMQIIFSFRDYCTSTKDKETYCSHLVHAIGIVLAHICKDQSVQVLFTYQCDKDFAFMADLKSKFVQYSNIRLVKELITLDNAQDYYGKTQLVITNRLHVLLLAYKYGALTVGLTDLDKHKKILGIFQDNRLSDQLIDIHYDNQEIIKAFKRITDNRTELLTNIQAAEDKNSSLLHEIFNHVFTNS